MSRLQYPSRRPGKAARAGISTFLANERGATAIEYGMIAAGIAVTIIGIVFTLGETVSTQYYEELIDRFEDGGGGTEGE